MPTGSASDAIKSVGVSLEPVEPATALPVFINMREIAHRIRDRLRQYRGKSAKAPEAGHRGEESH